MILDSMNETIEKWNSHVFGRPKFWMILRCYRISCVHIYSFAFGKETWMRATSATLMVIFLKVPFWKLLHHNYDQSSFSKIMRHIDKNILKETLKLKILRDNLFIKTWVNIKKQKSTIMTWKWSLLKQGHPALKRMFYQNRWYIKKT